MNLLILRRYTRALAFVGIIAILATCEVPVAASADSPPSLNTSQTGWVYYPVTVAITNAVTTTVQGVVGSNGGCGFSQFGNGESGGVQSTSIQIGLNISTCQAMFETGISTGAMAVPAGTVTTTDTKSTTIGAHPTPGSLTGYSANQNNQWLDPFGIQLDAMAQTVNWISNGTTDTSWSETPSYSRYWQDGWKVRWTNDNSNGSEPANSLANSSDQNNIFCAPYTTYGYFGWIDGLGKVNDYVYGYANGTYAWSSVDFVNGGCTSLIHHGHTNS